MKICRLTFAALAEQLEIVDSEEMRSYYGGYLTTNPDGPTDGYDCVYNSCAYVANYYGGGEYGYESGYWEGLYDSEYGNANEGVDAATLYNFLSSHFVVQQVDLSTLSGSLNVPIMCDYGTGSGVAHSVIIQYVDQNSQLAYLYDPTSGGASIKPLSEIAADRVFRIDGML
ncbi:hypothetical protein SAMN05444266_10870 [Chitinophaga jiangningensis]|uniref:Peptidase C39-like domain-containing protein n=1 Tax=Chitinophaga jiangningensis TaxID=1419482 RepID=A0A1M7IRH4_9BACT|nr:hypothetical protein [Chitinophaga jiangningensis]SHM43396.1 hypothetical protein SAMN05444266_10870 [Chitinophaga jiangningensis]